MEKLHRLFCLLLAFVTAGRFRTMAFTLPLRALRSPALTVSRIRHSQNFERFLHQRKVPSTPPLHDVSSSSSTTRLFGSKALPGNPPGTVHIEDSQSALKVDLERLRETVMQIQTHMGYPTYDVCLFLVEDDEMQETNLETRGVDGPTDILSFPFHPAVEPGRLEEPSFDIADYYNLGDMMIDVPYVMRRCQEDEADEALDVEDDRGVSGAMATVYDPEKRLHMLLVHGLLHLVGHDHEVDDEYELMVTKEEELLDALKLR